MLAQAGMPIESIQAFAGAGLFSNCYSPDGVPIASSTWLAASPNPKNMLAAVLLTDIEIFLSQKISRIGGNGMNPEAYLGDGISEPIGIPTTLTGPLVASALPRA